MTTFLLPDKPTKPFLLCLALTCASFTFYPALEKLEVLGDGNALEEYGELFNGYRSDLEFFSAGDSDSSDWSPLHEVLFLNGMIWSTYFLVRSFRIRRAQAPPS
jgi:hypothetical protein